MSEESGSGKEIAEAVKEVAKLGQAVIEPATELGRWVGRVLGTTPEDLVGLGFGDYMAHARIRRLAGYQQRTEEILRERGVDNPQALNPKLAIPALVAASEEGDESIQELWARLLANAMDQNRDVSLRSVFIDALKALEPMDVLVLDAAVRNTDEDDPLIDGDDVAKTLGVRYTQVAISLNHLTDLGCLHFNKAEPPARFADYSPSALGYELWLACQDDVGD